MVKPLDLQKPDEVGKEWLERIAASEQAISGWLEDAERAEASYLQGQVKGQEGTTPAEVFAFNILHSNIETISPSLYSSTPVPDVRERFRSGPVTPELSLARQASQVLERELAYQIDDGALDYEMEDVVQDAILAGRATLRVKFDGDVIEEPAPPVTHPITGQPILGEQGEPLDPATGEPLPPVTRVVNERLIYEAVAWRDYREGPATKWSTVPWVAFRQSIPMTDLDAMQDEKLATEIRGGASSQGAEALSQDASDTDATVWEIWDRETRMVFFVVHGSGRLLKAVPDPLKLRGFFPHIRPIQPIKATGRREPVVPFKLYQSLARQLDRITRRIDAIVDAMKVKGFYAGQGADLKLLAEADDNTLIPIPDMEGAALSGGVDKAISWWPIEQAVAVLNQLYIARDQTKAAIYEVTGISDIVRGASDADETATAQEIKSEWGSLRIRKLQSTVQRAAREVMLLSAEIIGSKFSAETLTQHTQIQVTPEIMQLIQPPFSHYRIDIETDSTVRGDLTRRQGEMTKLMEGMASFLAMAAPMIEQQPMMAGPLVEMFAAFARQFSLGKQGEDAVEQMIQIAKGMAQQAPMGQQEEQSTPLDAAKAEKAMAETRQIDTETALMGGPIMPGQQPTMQQAAMAGLSGQGPLAGVVDNAMNPKPAPAPAQGAPRGNGRPM